MAVTNGIITFIDSNNRFAYLHEASGASVRIPGKLVDFDKLQKGSEVMLQYDNEFINGEYKKGATKLLTINPPFEPVTALGTIARVSDKGFAFARCDGIKGDIFVPAKLFTEADVKPGRGMPVLLTVEQAVRGFAATALRWKPEELAQVAAVDHPKQGVLKHFIRKGMYGHVIIDGKDLFFHANGIGDKSVRASMLAGDIPNGSVLGFTVGKHKGKPVALITSVVSLAEMVSEATEESLAEEAAQVLAEAMTETNVEVVVEAAPAKPKRVRKPKAVKPVVDTHVVVAADMPDGPMADALRGLNLNGSGAVVGATTH